MLIADALLLFFTEPLSHYLTITCLLILQFDSLAFFLGELLEAQILLILSNFLFESKILLYLTLLF